MPPTFVQVPTWPVTLHALPEPHVAAPQQTPSVQNPLEHWLGPEQVAPAVSLLVQTPLPLQKLPLTHPASLAHVVGHAVVEPSHA